MDEKALADVRAKIAKKKGHSVLNLSNKGITLLPNEIAALQSSLQVLNLWFNKLIDLPPEIGRLSALRKLSIAHNKLRSLPSEISSLVSLRKLDLGRNKLESLPPEIGKLTSLRVLSIRENRLKLLPPAIGSLSMLRKLCLDYNHLQTLPSELGNLLQLRELKLVHNEITALPSAALSGLTSLVELLLGTNRLQSLPQDFGLTLSSLEVLSLWQNDLRSLPSEFGNYPHLKTRLTKLNLSGNTQLQSLPLSFTNLTALDPDNLSMPSAPDWLPPACVVPQGEPAMFKHKYTEHPGSLFDICCKAVSRAHEHNKQWESEQEKEGDDVSKILSGEWEIGPGGFLQPQRKKRNGHSPQHHPPESSVLPLEVAEKLEKEGKKCDHCGQLYFGTPAVSGVVTGTVGQARLWLSVAYCSSKCATAAVI